MNPEVHQQLLDTLTEVRAIYPSFRFGQLICALATAAQSAVPDSIYDLEDEELLEAVRAMIRGRKG